MGKDKFLNSFNLDKTELTPEEQDDIGHTDTIQHHIYLSDEVPVKQRHRRIPPNMYDEVRSHLLHLKNTGIIRESSSPWTSPVVLVRKKNGDLRMCVDYRLVNKKTIKDAYALPRIEELMDNFKNANFLVVQI